jgi:tetratricopeptide (TPR) repeat protein
VNKKVVCFGLIIVVLSVMVAADSFDDEVAACTGKLLPFFGKSDLKEILNEITSIENKLKENNLEKSEEMIAQVKLGILYHNVALNDGAKRGYKKYAQKSFETMKLINGNDGLSNVIKVYTLTFMGSSRAMMGDEDLNPINKINYVKEGIAYLDDAVKRFDRHTWVPRFYRANVCFSLPDFFEKSAAAKDDYDKLINKKRNNDNAIPDEIMAIVYLNRGKLYKKDTDIEKAIEMWKKALETAEDEDVKNEAEELLDIFS